MTPIAVVTVFAPRPEHPNWRDDYVPLLKLQRATANRFGHPHIVVTDGDLGRDFDEMAVTLPANLMRAQLAGQIAWLSSAQAKDCATLLVDADCLVARSLSPLFDGAEDFDLGLTPRADPVAPINNGAMYIPRGSAEAVLPFFRAALERCAEHWGGARARRKPGPISTRGGSFSNGLGRRDHGHGAGAAPARARSAARRRAQIAKASRAGIRSGTAIRALCAWRIRGPRAGGNGRDPGPRQFSGTPAVSGLPEIQQSRPFAAYVYTDFRVEPGEIYLSADEKKLAELARGARHPRAEHQAGRSPNKDWGWSAGSASPRAARSSAWSRSARPAFRQLEGVEFIPTRDIREACGVLSGAALLIAPEGGLHHAAAALGVRAVVIFGGFISPATTGYDAAYATSLPAARPAGCAFAARIARARWPRIAPHARSRAASARALAREGAA
jgi:hypothetical protein